MRNGNPSTLAKGWQWRKFGDCAQFINGRAYSQEELLDEGTPVLRIQNLNGGDRWYYSNLKLPDEKYCEAGDLLYAWSASFGPYRFAGPKSIFHYHIWRVIPGAELDKTFAFHLLEEITAEVKSAAHGVAMLHMTKGGIEAWPIPLPPLAEQRRIAEVLDRAETLRAKRRAALAQLDSLTQSLFLDLFGDPATNAKGWPKVELGEVVKLVGGYAFKSEDFAAEGNAVVRISNLTGDGIDLDGIARIPDHKLGKGVGYKIQPGDILIAMSGATTGKLGVVPLELGEDLYLNQRVGNYRIRDGARIQCEFLLGLLHSKFYQRFLWRLAAGAAQPNVSGWQLESAVVSLPPIELQREFARRVTAVEVLKTAQRASLAELDALFATLQHRAFRGVL